MDRQDHIPDSLARPTRPSRAEMVARVVSFLPDLPRESSRFRTALLYLASQWTPSIDRLAWFTGYEREFVARRARRWADHDLWGKALIWSAPDPERLARAVEIGEGLVPRPAPAPVGDDPPAYAALSDREGNAVTQPHPVERMLARRSGRGADTGATSATDGDALLASLWASLGLATPEAASNRLAA